MPSLTRPSPALALVLALTVAFAPALVPSLATSALAQESGPANGGPDNGSQRDANRSQDPNGSDDGDRSASERRGTDDGQGDRSDRGADDDRGPGSAGPPVEIEDRRGGFATRAEPGSPRPEVAVDAANASASVQRGDVRPLDVHLDEVLAFEDGDGDGAYDVGERVLDRQSLPEAPAEILVTANETRTAVYELGEEASLELVFDVSAAHGDEVGAKFDVEVHNYTFADGEDVHTALGSRIQVDGGLERVEREGRPAVVGEAGDDVAYLSWVQNATVDGTDHRVGSSVLVDAEERDSAVVYWAYPQGEEIVHDPELGVRDAVRELAGNPGSFAFGLAVTTTILFGGYAVRARWNR
jgi:hypothetical protein